MNTRYIEMKNHNFFLNKFESNVYNQNQSLFKQKQMRETIDIDIHSKNMKK